MTTLADLFDLKAYERLVTDRYIDVKIHPDVPELRIANYGPKTQYERKWTPETMACRGLIYRADTLKVIARGFPKFFNLSEHSPEEIPDGEAMASTKFDGSLGILYTDPSTGKFKIATRGSFTSEQAIKGTQILEEYLFTTNLTSMVGPHFFSYPGVTYLFEILYPENRIVCDYGDREALVLLDVIDNASGKSRLDLFTAIPWPDKAYKSLITDETDLSGLANLVPKGEEGFVLYWPENGFRVKVKSEEYVHLHRVVTGLSEKSVWEMLGQGMSVEQIKENVPDELFDWVDETATGLMDKAQDILDKALMEFDGAITQTTKDAGVSLPSFPEGLWENRVKTAQENRGLFAKNTMNCVYRPFLFKILDDASDDVLWSMAWKMVKPTGDTRVWNRNSDDGS